MKVDHFMYAVADMDEGISWAESVFGVRPVYGGAHKGLGTRNALLAFDDSYLEIIAPDPEQNLTGTMGERLASLQTGGLVTWAAQSDLTQTKAQLEKLSVPCHGPIETTRQQPGGECLVWQLLFPASKLYGVPFFIDWMACAHPANTSPKAGSVRQFSVHTPDTKSVQQIFSEVGLTVAVSDGAQDLRLLIETAKGQVELTSSDETRDIIVN